MLAESPLTLEPAGPEEPQAARLTANPAAEMAKAAERNFRNVMSFPFILRAQRWVPVTYEAGIASAPRRITHIDSVDVTPAAVRNISKTCGRLCKCIGERHHSQGLSHSCYGLNIQQLLTSFENQCRIAVIEMFRKAGISLG
jgi:hypothetical protein